MTRNQLLRYLGFHVLFVPLAKYLRYSLPTENVNDYSVKLNPNLWA